MSYKHVKGGKLKLKGELDVKKLVFLYLYVGRGKLSPAFTGKTIVVEGSFTSVMHLSMQCPTTTGTGEGGNLHP